MPLVRELQAAGSPGQAALGQGGKGADHHRPLALGLSVLSAPVRGWSAWVATAFACLPLAVLTDCQAGLSPIVNLVSQSCLPINAASSPLMRYDVAGT
eukprot:COSAG01_NODE_2754_length_7138_cov_16.469953_5_plen_98_part_00